MKRTLLLLLTAVLAITSCVDEKEYPSNARGDFEALWHIIDEHYCFFSYKRQAYGLDWDEVRQRYAPQIHDGMTAEQEFEVLGNMLGELRDGHVNMSSGFDMARYWSWREDYPKNFSENLLEKYLGTDYRISTGMDYRILDDNIGYIYCPSFNGDIGAGNLDAIISYLAPCNGLIIDIRENSGGMLTNAQELASRFTNEEVLVGYTRHKTGKGHDDFSPMQPQTLKPGSGMRWQKGVVVLTNRGVFSAANEFVKYMGCFPNVRVVGDTTGGGAGMPFSSELPNGWSVRFSAEPMYDKGKNSTEFGIAPDHNVALSQADLMSGKDTLIEFARQLLVR